MQPNKFMFKPVLSIIKMGIKEGVAYRPQMLLTLISFPIFFLTQFFLWTSIFGDSPNTSIAGFDLTQMVGYYIVGLLILVFTYSHITTELHNGIREGHFIKFIIKPISYPFFSFWIIIGGRILAFVMEAIPLLFVVGLMLGFDFFLTPNLTLFLISFVFAFFINYLLSLIMGTLIFWFTNPNGITWIYRLLRYFFAGGILPLTFFPEIIQYIILLTPFPLMYFIPAFLFVGNNVILGIEITPLLLLIYGAIQLIIFSLIAYFLWRRGVKTFQGVGA